MLPLDLYARVPPLAMCIGTRDRGCGVHPVFPAPSVLQGGKKKMQTSGVMRREIAKVYLQVSFRDARSASFDVQLHIRGSIEPRSR